MILTPAVLILALASLQSKTTTDPHFPAKPEQGQQVSKITDWHGWSYLQGSSAIWPKIYPTIGDWSEIQTKYAAVRPANPSNWNLRVVIFTRVEEDGRDQRGVLRERRATIESTQLTQIREALDRFQAYVTAKYDGAVRIVPDIQVEAEWMRESGANPFGPQFATKYFEPRINGGTYEAEDKIFRGPFHSAIYIIPGSNSSGIASETVNDTPVVGIMASPLDTDENPTNFDNVLRQAWIQEVTTRAKQLGFAGVTNNVGAEGSPSAWTSLTDLGEIPPEKFIANFSKTLDLHPVVGEPTEIKSTVTATTDVQVVTDPEKGNVLKIVELSGQRSGGFALPAKADGSPITKTDTNQTLSFSVRTASKDPLSLRLDSSNGKSVWVSLGSDPILVAPMSQAPVVSLPLVPNGKWQHISVDLHGVATEAGLVDVQRVEIEPSPNARLNGKLQPEAVEYFFDDFKIDSEAPTARLGAPVPDANSDDPESRALFASQAKAVSSELANLLKDKSELVRLNATSAYIGLKDPSVEPALIANSVDLDPEVASAALAALWAEGSDVARAIVIRSVSVSLSDYTKMTAAQLLADTKDPKMADNVSRLLASRSWQAHVRAVEALAEIPTPESQIWRLAFLGMTEPAVKLAVTRTADPSMDKVVSALLWSAVNEPSDCVRAESYIKLINSSLESNKQEGYKGVRDDSRFVRKLVVEYLAQHPSENHRNALRIAIADKSAAVRSAAIEGFAALEKGASVDEIANVLDDLNPDVQLALIHLSKVKALKLPQKTLDAMSASPDTRVVAARKALG